MRPNVEVMRKAAMKGYTTATDLADWLVRELGLPFREAHHVTGRLVSLAEGKGVILPELTLADMQAVASQDHRGRLQGPDGRGSVAARQELWRHRACQCRSGKPSAG